MLKLTLIIGLLLCIYDVASAQCNGCDFGSGLRKALIAYDTAWNKKNVNGVAASLADDYVYFSSTGGLTDRKKTLEFLASPDYKLTFVERSEIVVLHSSNEIYVISTRWKGRGTYGKEEINDDQRCGLVFVRQAKQWKLLSEHCTQIVTK